MNKRILVIDDEEPIRKSFLLAFEDEEYAVDTAASGEEGIGLYKSTRHELVFLDLRMPGLNGIETLRELRKIDSEVPIYIITAFHAAFFDQLKEAAEDGLQFEVMQKPLNADEIVAVTKSVVENGHNKRSNAGRLHV